jgi:hypothetical protein
MSVNWDPPVDATDVDSYKVVWRRGDGTILKTTYVGAGTRHQNWNIPDAERTAHPHAVYNARVTSIEDPYSEDIDDGISPGMGAESSSSIVTSADEANAAVWGPDDVDPAVIAGTDGSAPSSSPAAPTVLGGPGFLSVAWTAVANADPVTYEVHVSVTTGFTPSAGTLVGEVSGTLYFIKQMPDDTDLDYGITYYVKIVAKDTDGSAAAGSQGSGSMVQVNYPDIAVDAIRAGQILARSVTADKLAATLIISSILKTAETGRRWEADLDGMRLIESDESILFSIPTDSAQPAVFNGALVASSLTATGPVSLRSTGNNITKVGKLTLEAGQQAATAAPVVSTGFESFAATAKPTDARGAWHDGTNLWMIGGTGNTQTAYKFNTDGTSLVASATLAMPWLSTTWYVPNIVKIGSYWYGVGRWIQAGNPILRLITWNALGTGGLPGAVTASALWNEWRGYWNPMVATNGTSLFIAQSTKTNATPGQAPVRIGTYTAPGTGAAATFSSTLDTDSVVYGQGDIQAFYYGNGDYGATRIILCGDNSTTTGLFNSSGLVQVNETWDLGLGLSGQRGIYYDGSRFYQPTSGTTIVKYSLFKASGATSTEFWVAFTYYDSNATVSTHESPLSPRANIFLVNRRKLSVTWPTIPDFGGTDDADTVRIYMKANATDPGEAFTSYFKQGGNLTGTQTYIEAYSTATAGTTPANFFLSGTGAEITDTSGTLHIRGDGMVRWRAPVVVVHAAGDFLLAVGTARIYTDWDTHDLEVIPPGAVASDMHNETTNPSRFKVPTGWGGIWELHVQLTWSAGAAADGRRIYDIRKNSAGSPTGGSLLLSGRAQGSDALDTTQLRWIGLLAAGDYCEVNVNNITGSDRDIVGGAASTTAIWRYHGEA